MAEESKTNKVFFFYGALVILMSNELAKREIRKLPKLFKETGDGRISRNAEIRKALRETDYYMERRFSDLFHNDNGKKNKCEDLHEVESRVFKAVRELEPIVAQIKKEIQDYLTANDCCYEDAISQMVIVGTLINNANELAPETETPDQYAEAALKRMTPVEENESFKKLRKAFYAWPDYLEDYGAQPAIHNAVEKLGDAFAEVYTKYFCEKTGKISQE